MVGRVLTHYRVIDKLGAGGMGEVWRALDLRLEREVALKVLAQHRELDASAQKRFLREAKSVSSLNHPNIVTVYEVDSDGGNDFIVMELVKGQTLSHLMRECRLPRDTIVAFSIAIAEALQCAHSAGIVHRDLKPGNVMVTAEGRVKVLDFGLAKRADSAPLAVDEPTRTELTAAGRTSGTVSYMSPEQAAGDILDGRSDIFSLGVVMYQMLSGRLPFEGASAAAKMRNLIAHDPPPLTGIAPGGTAGLREVVSRCLQKDPGDRYQSAGAVAEALRGAGETKPVTARRSRAWMAAAALVVLAGAGTWFAVHGRHTSTSEVLNGDPAELTRSARLLLDRYDRTGNLDRATQELNRAIHTDPNYAPAYAVLAETEVRQAMIARDPQGLKSAEAYARKAISLEPDLAAGQVALGNALNESGKRGEAAAAFQKALTLDPGSSAAHVGLGKSEAATGDAKSAEAEFAAAVKLGPWNWQAHLDRGIFYYRNSRYAEAIASFEAAGAIASDQVGVLRNLAAAYHVADRTDEAASTIQRALEIRPSGALYTNLGTLRFFQGRYLDALPPMQKAVELDPNNYLSWGNLGDVYRWTPGNQDKVAEPFERAIELVREKIKAAPADAELSSTLAMYLAKSGSKAAALKELQRLYHLPPKTGSAWYRGGLAYEISGDRQAALEWIGRALASGYSVREIRNDPELLKLRDSKSYHLAEEKALKKDKT